MMKEEYVVDYLLHAHLKDGDVLFINAEAINLETIVKMKWPEKMPAVVIIPVFVVDKGRSVYDEVYHMTAEELRAKTLQE